MNVTCLICGFDKNTPDKDHCVKCGEMIEHTSVDLQEITNDMKQTIQQVENTFPPYLKKTRILDNETSTTFGSSTLRDKMDQKVGEQISLFDHKESESIPHPMNDQSEPSAPSTPRNNKKTLFVDEFKVDKSNIKFELLPIGNESKSALRFYEEGVTLKRSDIDEGDMTISSNDHVQIEKTKSGWKLKNVSSNGAVFIRVEDEIEIRDNDINIIGKNKTYLFKPK